MFNKIEYDSSIYWLKTIPDHCLLVLNGPAAAAQGEVLSRGGGGGCSRLNGHAFNGIFKHLQFKFVGRENH